MKLKYANLGFTPKEINTENYTLRAIFSTDDVDRHGEVVDQKSWLLDDFMKNPVVLFGHQHGQPPVGKVTGLGYNSNGDLEGEIQFAAEQYPFANVIWNLYRDGFMKAFSVGFSSGAVDNVDGQVVLRSNTLFEISTVSVPANQLALAKSKGLDITPLDEKFIEIAKAEEKICPCEDDNKNDDTPEVPAVTAEEVTSEDVVTPTEETTDEEAPSVEDASTDTKTIEKGAVQDELDGMDEREKKWMLIEPVYEVFGAFVNVFYEDTTPSSDFGKLLKETGELFVKHAGNETDATEAINKYVGDTKKTLLEILLENQNNDEVTKALGDVAENIKAGKVLSTANRSKVESAVDALQKVLNADTPKEDKSSTSDNITEKVDSTDDVTIKVETPAVRVSVSKTSPNKIKSINKAIRALLEEKRTL